MTSLEGASDQHPDHGKLLYYFAPLPLLLSFTFPRVLTPLFLSLFFLPHVIADVRAGEALMKELYEELVASPAWNETLLIITYDEHGGQMTEPSPLASLQACLLVSCL